MTTPSLPLADSPAVPVGRAAIAVALLVLLAAAVRVAWLGDDAYITLRVVENCALGEGLRWNAADRAMVSTHPLWLLLLTSGRVLTGEVYYTTIAISLLLATAAMVLLLRRARTGAAVVLVAGLLLTSRAFPEYCTSGLETPLSYLLLTCWFGSFVAAGDPLRRFRRVAALTVLLVMTRMDFAVLVAPVAIASLRGVPWSATLRCALLAGIPLWCWLAFAVGYFGTPFPVTAYAKAFGLGIPAADIAAQGVRFLLHTAVDDPVLVATTVLGLCLGLWQRSTCWLACGGVLYLAYVVKVGGDFMAGRFFLPPFVIAFATIAHFAASFRGRGPWLAVAIAFVLMFVRGVPAWLQSPAADTVPAAALEETNGIVDERRMHYSRLGLLAPTRQMPRYGEMHDFVWPEGRDQPWILLNGAVGIAGFQMGARGHVLDPLLCDPLLTRLPARDPRRWRIGHVLRRIPEGYYETLAAGENRLRHPGLRAYYDALCAQTRLPLWSGERWALLWRMAKGEFDAGFRAFLAEEYFTPPRLPIAANELTVPLPLGAYWFDEPRIRLVYDGGVAIAWPAAQTARRLQLQATGFYTFRCRFLRDGRELAEAVAVRRPLPPEVTGLRAVAGLREEVVDVPPAAVPFDALWIDAVENPETHTSPGPSGLGAITMQQ